MNSFVHIVSNNSLYVNLVTLIAKGILQRAIKVIILPKSKTTILSFPDQVRFNLLFTGSQDQDVLHAWLMDIHFEEYLPLFLSAGYDMYTISRMTPEDLTAIGIKKPNHRKRLKAEIAQLNISDGLPDYIPVSIIHRQTKWFARPNKSKLT